MKVYVVLSQHKACCDCDDVFNGVFASREKAKEYISNFYSDYQKDFEILEYVI